MRNSMRLGKLLSVVFMLSFQGVQNAKSETLISPMIEGLDLCEDEIARQPNIDAIREACRAKGLNAGSLIEKKLSEIGPKRSASGRYVLGYTLTIELLNFIRVRETGWSVDEPRLQAYLNTIASVDRDVVLYLWSNHFNVNIDREVKTLLRTKVGELQVLNHKNWSDEDYFSVNLLPFTLEHGSLVQQMREAVARAALSYVCTKPAMAKKVKAVSVLGETHFMWPDFQSMGYGRADYRIADYSEASAEHFRRWLRERFAGRVAAFNRYVGASYNSFETISPPSKDIRKEMLLSFSEHIDPYAHGIIPVFGWAHTPTGTTPTVTIYLNGALQGEAKTNVSRMDILDTKPEFGTPLVGFRFDLDYRHLPPGIHRLQVTVSDGQSTFMLADRNISIGDRSQSESKPVPSYAPVAAEIIRSDKIEGYVDHPAENTSFFYNPLAELWLEFREATVRELIESFGKIAGDYCIGSTNIFSHQVAPSLYGSWDPTLMAVDASLKPNVSYQHGVTLYGGGAFGDAFFDSLKQNGVKSYGVGEINPLMQFPDADIVKMIERHREAGASYVSPYYLTLAPKAMRSGEEHGHSRFLIEDGQGRSPSFLAGMQRLMRQ